jgi:hypothetical protein
MRQDAKPVLASRPLFPKESVQNRFSGMDFQSGHGGHSPEKAFF